MAAAGGLPHWVAPPQEHELQGTKGFEKHAAGNGDYLPPYAGNLDIMTAAAVRIGETLANERIGGDA